MLSSSRPIAIGLGVFTLALLAAASAVAQPYNCEEVMVPMRDGTKLAADVYMPVNQGDGPFPVILERTPYNKGDCAHRFAPYFAQRGYVAIVQDERGRYNSEGVYHWLLDQAWHERQDGYDTIEWAGTQPWSTGKVGTQGLSFTCFNQYLTAPTRPPHLAAMFCAHSASNAYKDLYWAGGALHMIMPTWLLSQNEMVQPVPLDDPGRRTGYVGRDQAWLQWHQRRLETEMPIGQSMLTRMMTDMIENPYYNDYWRQYAVDEQWDQIDTPIMHYASWYDRYPHSQVGHFNGIQAQGMPNARDSQRLFVGPWLHGAGLINARVIGDLDFGPEAAIDYNGLRLRWFDYHLKGIDNGIMDEPKVSLFIMGANTWRREHEYPIAREVRTDYYFRADKADSVDSLNDGTLSTEAPGDEAPDTYEYDPRDPVPSIGGDQFIQPMGARDNRPADVRSLTFTTPVLEEDTEVTGMPTVELWASSSAVDTDWTVTITDVHPDGYSQTLRQNILRARYREGDEAPVLMSPGEVYKFVIEMYPISNLFKAGHRIRMTVSSSAFPKWLPNGNTGREMDEDMPVIIAENTIYHDAERPSKAILPIIPAGSASAGDGRH